MRHAASAKGEVVLELHGMGPFDINYVNPADNPAKDASAASSKQARRFAEPADAQHVRTI